MSNLSLLQRVIQWLAITALLGFGLATAQSGPTMNQVYEAAQAGRLEQAQTMMQQVLVAYPNSAKAHFVQAELFARQRQPSRARESLATAEKLAPGLPFAKPEAVQALRAQLASKAALLATGSTGGRTVSAGSPVAPATPFPWGIALLLAGGLAALGILLLRKKAAPPFAPQGDYTNPTALQGGLNGPQSFGNGGGVAPPVFGNGQPGYGQPGYGQPAGSGIGGRVMGGLAAGLAVGGGVMAAQAIGKTLMGKEERPQGQLINAPDNGNEALAGNNDMGGQNFGVNDASSWDDGGSLGGGGDNGEW